MGAVACLRSAHAALAPVLLIVQTAIASAACQQLAEPSIVTVGSNPQSVAIADFNGDGIPDLATANANSNNVSVLLGLGSGEFSPKVDYATAAGPFCIVAADVNRDGASDVVIANSGAN